MSTSVPLPALGESVTEGTVSRWLKQVGDRVEVDEPLLEVSTDKVDTEVPSPVAGVLLEIKAAEDDTVEVGAVLAVIGDEGDEPAAAPTEQSGAADDTSAGDTSADSAADATDAAAAPTQDSAPVAEKPEAEQPAAETQSAGDGEGTEVTLPALGESVTEGTVSRWLKQVGDTVEVDEPLLEVSTDKVDTEVPSPVAGTITEIRAEEDATVEVGAVLAVIGGAAPAAAKSSAPAAEDASGGMSQAPDQTSAGDEGGQAPIPAPAAEESAPEPEKPAEPEKSAEPAEPEPAKPAEAAKPAETSSEAGYVTPLVRKLAAEHGVDLASVQGSGVGGRVRKQDVLAAAEEAKARAAAPAETPASQGGESVATEAPTDARRGTTEKLSRLRTTIAKRMVESLQVSAQLTATVEVDLTLISRLRATAKEDFAAREGVKLSYLPFISKAVIEALKQHPLLNATIDTEAGTVTYSDAEHLGIAVDTPRGLLVPVIKNAGDLNVAGLARRIGELAERTRTNAITPDDLTGGTFTITNYGSAGTLLDTPIINQPQVAILGTGALVKRPVVLDDAIAVRDMMYLSLTYDHRLVDGADAARFLSTVKARLEGGDFASELGR